MVGKEGVWECKQKRRRYNCQFRALEVKYTSHGMYEVGALADRTYCKPDSKRSKQEYTVGDGSSRYYRYE